MRYDCVVIGSGLGGLSSALKLLTKGKKVLILEMHNLPGGCATSFVRGRYEFEASLHELCDIGENTLCRKMLEEEFGLNLPLIKVPEMLRTVYTSSSGKRVDLVLPLGKEDCLNELDKAFPGNRKGLENFFSFLEECDAASNYFASVGGKVTLRSGLTFLRKYARYVALAYQPFNKVCRKLGLNEEIIEALDSYWSYLGANTEEVAFVHYGMLFYAYCYQGPYFYKGTSHALSSAMVSRIKELGGEIYFNTKADKVISDEKGKIIGVKVGDRIYETSHVIANMSPNNAYETLLDEHVKIPKREKRRIQNSEISIKLTNIYLGLRKSHEEMGINNYTNFFNTSLKGDMKEENSPLDYESVVATCYNVVDPSFSPRGTTILTLTLVYDSPIHGNIKPEEYEATKWAVTKKAIEEVERKAGFKIQGNIEEIEVATPVTLARYIGTPDGTPYGYKQTQKENIVARMVSKNKDQPIKGFKTVGAFGTSGDGYVQNLNEGAKIADMTLKEMEEKK